MDNFASRIKSHIGHVEKVGAHCSTEETTKQALILPLLDILGFSPYDPLKVKAEYAADFPGAKASERVDYALFCQGVPVMFIEAKAFNERLSNHAPQLSRYFNATPEVTMAAITNGREWRFFTDLNARNIMDQDPFLTVNFSAPAEDVAPQLYRFRHDEFQPEALRTLAEESIYLSQFKAAISASLRDCDPEFVRYVATRAQISRQLNARFIESITPLVKQAVERSVSEMVLSGLSAPPVTSTTPEESAEATPADDPTADQVNPENSKIVTTFVERSLFSTIKDMLGEGTDIHPKDTESYFSVLYQNKVNRWVVRYWADKRRPHIALPLEMTESRRVEVRRAGLEISENGQIFLDRPEHILRLAGLIFDALGFCQNDENFKKSSDKASA